MGHLKPEIIRGNYRYKYKEITKSWLENLWGGGGGGGGKGGGGGRGGGGSMNTGAPEYNLPRLPLFLYSPVHPTVRNILKNFAHGSR